MGQTCVQCFGSISNRDRVMTVERVWQEFMFRLQRIPYSQLIQPKQMLFVDRVTLVADILYPPLHTRDALFHLVRWSVAGKNSSNALAIVIDALNVKSRRRFILHCFLPEGSD